MAFAEAGLVELPTSGSLPLQCADIQGEIESERLYLNGPIDLSLRSSFYQKDPERFVRQ